MCEATAYMIREGQEEIILESVDIFEADNGQVKLVNIFGEEKKVKARIKALSLVDHKIILEPLNT